MKSAFHPALRRPYTVKPNRTDAPKLKHESLYVFWTRFGIENDIASSDFSDLHQRVLVKPVFQQMPFAQEYAETLSKILGINNLSFRRLCGDDLKCKSGEGLAIHKGLRYCFKCLKMGYHSVVYQHLAISHCPLHGSGFEIYCRGCGYLIEPTFKSALLSPFECNRCDQPLVKTVATVYDVAEKSFADQMVGARRPVLGKFELASGPARRFLKDPAIRQTSKQASLGRVLQRQSVWEDPSDPHWIRFPSVQIPLRPDHHRGEFNASDSLNVGLAAERTIIWILQQLRQSDLSSLVMLSNRLGRRPAGLRINADVTLIGAACYKLLVAYDLEQEAAVLIAHHAIDLNAKAVVCYGRPMQRYGDAAVQFPKLNFRLMQFEMLGLFAKLLVEARDGLNLTNLSWVDSPHPSEFAPAWKVTAADRFLVANVRFRANEELILRLLKRQVNKRLTYQYTAISGLWQNNWVNNTWVKNK